MIKTLLIPIIKKYYKLLISILIVQALGCTIIVSLSSSYKSLEKTLNNYVKDYNYPDGVIITEITSRDKKNKNITISPRLSFDTIMKSNEKYLSSRIISYGKNDFYKFHEWESIDEQGVYLEYNFAHDNEIKVGDEVGFKINDEYRYFKVSKIVSTPETLSIESSDGFTGFNNDFGYVYVNDEIFISELNKESELKKQEVDDKEKELEEKKKNADEEYNKALESIKYYEDLINGENEKLVTLKNELDNAEGNLNKISDQLTNLESTRKELLDALSNLKGERKNILKQKEELSSKNEKLLQAQQTLEKINSSIEELNKKNEELIELQEIIEVISYLPEETKINKILDEIIFIKNLTTQLEEYGIQVDIEGNVWEAAHKIDNISNQILSDYEYLNDEKTKEYISNLNEENTEEYNKLYTTLKRYYPLLKEKNISESIPVVYKRIEVLKNIIDKSNGIQIIKKIGSLEKITFKEMLNKVIEKEEKLRKYETVKDLIKVYNENKNLITNTLNELQTSKNNIINEITKYGINPNEIDKYITEIENGLKTIEENLPKIDNYILEITNNLLKIDEAYNYLLETYNFISSNRLKYLNTYNDGLNKLINSRNELDMKNKTLQEEYLNSLKLYNDTKEEIREAYKKIKDKYNFDNYCNEFLLKFDSSEPNELLKSVEKELGVEIKNSYTYEDSNVKNRIDINIEPIKAMSTFMPIVFFIIIMIVIFLFMSLLIKQCRKEIGILRALGFSKIKIRIFFIVIVSISSILSVFLGLLISFGILKYIGTYFENFFPLPTFEYILNNKMFIIGAVITIIISIISTLISTTAIDSINPSEAMTRETPDNKNNFKIINKLKISPFTKFSIISLIRNKVKFIFSVICISACVVMIFSSLSFISSKNYILDELYNKRINYDAQIYFKDELDENIVNELNELDFVTKAEELTYYDIDIKSKEKIKNGIINGINPNTDLINIEKDIQKDGIVLEEHLANYLGVNKGDIVTVGSNDFKITDISKQSINRINYMSLEESKKLGTSEISSILLNIDEEKENELLEYLTKKDNYLYTVFTNRSYNTMLKIFKTYDLAAWIIIIFAIIIGFVIVLNTSLTNLLEQKKKLSLVKALGHQYNEISKNWFIQSIIQFILSLIIGLPIGVEIAKVSLQKLSTENREYVYVNSIEMYIVTILLVFIYILISHIISMKTLRKFDIVENIKERE